MSSIKEIIRKEKNDLGINEYSFIKTNDIAFSDEVRKACEKNVCVLYGKSCACPPAVGTIEQCREQCSKYENAFVEQSDDGVSYDSQAGFNVVMSIFDLFYYSKSELRLSGEWAGVQSLSGMVHSGQSVGSNLFTPFSESFCERHRELEKACIQLHGEATDYADVSYIIKVFDFLPVMLQFWDGDDEFPAQVKIFGIGTS